MSTSRILTFAAALIPLATAAAAQTSAGMEPIQPVMDSPILAHVIFS